jgi:hypothetical protein
MSITFKRIISCYLILAVFLIGIVPRVDAGFVPSEIINYNGYERSADIEKIQKVIETKIISERLKQLGLNKEEIYLRLEQLSDRQLHNLAMQIDDLKVGQGDVFGVIIALLVIAILVVVLLKLTGHKVIITK